jgi:hypothetical protein
MVCHVDTPTYVYLFKKNLLPTVGESARRVHSNNWTWRNAVGTGMGLRESLARHPIGAWCFSSLKTDIHIKTGGSVNLGTRGCLEKLRGRVPLHVY